MSQFPSPFGLNRPAAWDLSGAFNPAMMRFFNAVYAWMCVGLAITAAVAWYVAQPANYQVIASMGNAIWLLFIVEIVLVMVIAGAINRINATVATLLFVVYAAINGVVLSSLFRFYAKSDLSSAFLISAGTFGVMSCYGMFTKRNLSGLGRYLMMALIGIVIASIVSIFVHNSLLQVGINYIGVLLFVILTAYDTQKLKAYADQTQNNPALAARMSIVGSLILYLDFINLFIFIVSIISDRRR